ncbi:MAG: tryptophan synthase subunit alpha [Chloroflexi bacterium AL-W]|nr:tryptophan synthase subunit alpha [Chloroflexi bacterium AL-W]
MTVKQGISAIAAMFAATQEEGRAAFLPFFPIGYPTYEDSVEAIVRMAAAGADGFEIGVPFSDPLADGPIIQEATQVALENGVTIQHALSAVRTVRKRGVTQPIFIFSYLNPLINYGTEQIVQDAKAAGADGFIIPDLPPEEAHLFQKCHEEDMALVFFLAPTSDTRRVELVAQQTTGFIYVVSLTGTTGTRQALPEDLQEFIARLRAQTDAPLVLGFGISTPEHARMMNGLVNGFIVGSALVRAAKTEGVDGVHQLTQRLRDALD